MLVAECFHRAWGERCELSTTAPHHQTFTAQEERQWWCPVKAARPSSTPPAHTPLSMQATAGPGGRLQPVLMRPTTQLSFKTWGWGGGVGGGSWGGGGPAGGRGGGCSCRGSGGCLAGGPRGVLPGVRGGGLGLG